MKKLTILISILFISLFTWSQAPQKMSYQAVIRNSNNQLVTSSYIGIQITISSGTTPVYSEYQSPKTNTNGLISIIIGEGNVTLGNFNQIDWSKGTFYITTEVDPRGGSTYSITSKTQLLSVPYALNAGSCDYANISNKPTLASVATSGNYNDLTNKPTINSTETKLSAGSNVSITGNGTTTTPYVINATNGGFTHYIGELYGGGIVVSVWKTEGVEHGLIVALADLPSLEIFSNINTGIPDWAATSYTDGQGNSNSIIAQVGHKTSAAKNCDDYSFDGYTDWYLPAIFELKQIYDTSYIINCVLGDAGSFKKTNYWSSTDNPANGPLYLEFKGGYMGSYKKSDKIYVRPVRRF